MKAQQVQVPCNIGAIIPGTECASQTTLYTVSKAGAEVGNVCREHITLIDQSQEPFKYGFAGWKE